MPTAYPTTPDGRYFVVRGRLWRRTDPLLERSTRESLVRELMDARRALRKPLNAEASVDARGRIDAAKRALGERGPVWWTDAAPDYGRHLAKNTPYASWFEGLVRAGLDSPP